MACSTPSTARRLARDRVTRQLRVLWFGLAVLLGMLWTIAVHAQPETQAADLRAQAGQADTAPEASVFLHNRRIVGFRTSLSGDTPAERAALARAALEDAVAKGGPGKVSRSAAGDAIRFELDGQTLCYLAPHDLAGQSAPALLERRFEPGRTRHRQPELASIYTPHLATSLRFAVGKPWWLAAQALGARTETFMGSTVLAGLMPSMGASGVAQDPAPFVTQTGPADFYIAYRLCAQSNRGAPRRRAQIIDALHANIVDVFNEHGVQIMSPHDVEDPAQAKIVRPSVGGHGDGRQGAGHASEFRG